ncbi:DUF6879 family protein [Actinoalloteichus hymeniacidonis]|uniref:DUF6879 domain-containing protein n=1 Tax=Actinoalloteichus hymeniacidonis TaxID=340345 RepID=A0AAC9HV39_9PSEU|nr:DUF6879 family protein [Actinoalloteichus hymeniacidonis]AOS65541.1 hypothetical protein TL08_23805 [Actinoalloteichus hymeniacidonis]MBB5906371.1 hypothetical protein [Actinoalloteichus hymeniacidonis]
MHRFLDGAELARLFARFRRSAWRFETQSEYREVSEAEPYRRFLAGELGEDRAWMTEWLRSVSSATRQGRSFARVRVVAFPPTDYQRFEMAVAPDNEAAGEDIRVLSSERARRLLLPAQDFWLFDDTILALMHFGSGRLTGIEVTTDVTRIEQYRAHRRRAWSQAVPLNEHMTIS